MKTTPAGEFIHLGDLIRYVARPKAYGLAFLLDAITPLEQYLETQPFEHIGLYLSQLKQFREWLQGKHSFHHRGELPDEAAQRLTLIIDPLRNIIYSESYQWQTIILNQSAVSAKLRALNAQLNFDDQKALLADTIRCLECGAPRAAIVMGWNLTYDYLRRWVFVDTGGRLATFNALLTTKKRNKTDLYEPIADYERFQDLGERSMIDWLFEAKLIDKGPYQLLVDALNRRNHFAHPGFAKATDVSAAGYVEHLLINVFDNPMFAY